MKVVVKKLDSLRRELSFEIPKERVSLKLEEVYKDLSKVAKVKGFREGKAPRQVIERQHGELAKEETVKKLIPEVYHEGIKQENIAPLDLPEIHDVNFKDGIITFKAQIDLKPEVKIKSYKGIKVQRKSAKVTDEEINKTLDYFKKSTGQDESLAIDDKFAKGLGYPSLNAFKESISRQMEMDKDRHNRLDVENQIVDHLIKESKLDVPKSMIKRQLEHRLQESKKRMKQQGVAEDEIKKKEPEVIEELEPIVEKDVKIYLIFDKIAELESITAKEGEPFTQKVMEFLLKEAEWREEQSVK